MAKGIVKWYGADKGYGFISPAGGGPDVFVHRSALKSAGMISLAQGDEVEYELGVGRKAGQKAAVSLRLVRAAA